MGVGENTENPGTGGAGRGSADGTPLSGTPGVPGEGFMYGYTVWGWPGSQGRGVGESDCVRIRNQKDE